MKDQYGRTIDYLRISITDACNLRCRYCMPHGIEWIPMEENYFSKMQVRERCELCFDTTHAKRVDGQQEER